MGSTGCLVVRKHLLIAVLIFCLCHVLQGKLSPRSSNCSADQGMTQALGTGSTRVFGLHTRDERKFCRSRLLRFPYEKAKLASLTYGQPANNIIIHQGMCAHNKRSPVTCKTSCNLVLLAEGNEEFSRRMSHCWLLYGGANIFVYAMMTSRCIPEWHLDLQR